VESAGDGVGAVWDCKDMQGIKNAASTAKRGESLGVIFMCGVIVGCGTRTDRDRLAWSVESLGERGEAMGSFIRWTELRTKG